MFTHTKKTYSKISLRFKKQNYKQIHILVTISQYLVWTTDPTLSYANMAIHMASKKS